MRGLTPGLQTPTPMAERLPAVLQEDPVLVAMVSGFDEVLAPAIAALDCLDAYLDPRLAPGDFLEGLAAWVGVTLDENWPLPQRRDAVAHAVELHRCRGTAWGLQWQLDLMTGGRAEVVDSGGVSWSHTPGSADGVAVAASLVVRVREMTDAEVDAVRALVAWAKPAHVPHSVELRSDEDG
jgi:phage tail-like protein